MVPFTWALVVAGTSPLHDGHMVVVDRKQYEAIEDSGLFAGMRAGDVVATKRVFSLESRTGKCELSCFRSDEFSEAMRPGLCGLGSGLVPLSRRASCLRYIILKDI